MERYGLNESNVLRGTQTARALIASGAATGAICDRYNGNPSVTRSGKMQKVTAVTWFSNLAPYFRAKFCAPGKRFNDGFRGRRNTLGDRSGAFSLLRSGRRGALQPVVAGQPVLWRLRAEFCCARNTMTHHVQLAWQS